MSKCYLTTRLRLALFLLRKRNFYKAIGLEKMYNIDEKSIMMISFVGDARKIKAKPAISGN